jgi:hypothetical protein
MPVTSTNSGPHITQVPGRNWIFSLLEDIPLTNTTKYVIRLTQLYVYYIIIIIIIILATSFGLKRPSSSKYL